MSTVKESPTGPAAGKKIDQLLDSLGDWRADSLAQLRRAAASYNAGQPRGGRSRSQVDDRQTAKGLAHSEHRKAVQA